MSKPTLGIIGGGQLGSMLAIAANKLDIKTIIFCDDIDAPAQNFSNEFIHGDYNDQNKIKEFDNKVDIITFEFENIPFETLNEIKKTSWFLGSSISWLLGFKLSWFQSFLVSKFQCSLLPKCHFMFSGR